jgi:GNAT superfamily N-acetyltransferase
MHNGQPVTPWFRAIAADGEMAGFLMLTAVTEWEPVPYVWRLLIDRRHQRRGIGDAVLRELIDRLRGERHRALDLSYVDAPGGPARFYGRLGFVPTGEMDGDETVARLELS